jgi:hypothetical protein
VFSDDKGYYSAEQEKLQEILCFFLPVIVFIFKRGCRTAGDEFVETKRGFCWEHAPSQKPLSVFTHLSHFKRFKFIFEAYFSEKATGNTLFFLPVLVFIFKRGFRTYGDEFVETKRGFCWEHAPSQKPLSVFTQLSHFKRFKFIFEAYFSEIS